MMHLLTKGKKSYSIAPPYIPEQKGALILDDWSSLCTKEANWSHISAPVEGYTETSEKLVPS